MHDTVKHTKRICSSSDVSINADWSRVCLRCGGKEYTIDCPKCLNAISSRYQACPHCGNKNFDIV